MRFKGDFFLFSIQGSRWYISMCNYGGIGVKPQNIKEIWIKVIIGWPAELSVLVNKDNLQYVSNELKYFWHAYNTRCYAKMLKTF